MGTIVKVPLHDLDQVCGLFSTAVSSMIDRKIYQWDEVYPTREVFEEDIRNETMFGLYSGSTLKSVVVLNTVHLPEYACVEWKSEESHALVMHRLCTHPRFQQEGLASAMVRFAEQHACAQHFRSIRLDAFLANDAALKLYEKHQFIRVGIMQLRKGPFVGYEKMLRCHET